MAPLATFRVEAFVALKRRDWIVPVVAVPLKPAASVTLSAAVKEPAASRAVVATAARLLEPSLVAKESTPEELNTAQLPSVLVPTLMAPLEGGVKTTVAP